MNDNNKSRLNEFLKKFGKDVVDVEHHVLNAVKHVPHYKHDHPPMRNVHEQVMESFTPLERAALVVTQHVGSVGFFLIILAWSVVWLLWNTLAPAHERFDPAPAFVMWLFISNLIQIMLMPLIMVGQNLLSRHSELRAEEDFSVNIKAEQENQAILLHLEHQAAQIERQGELMLEILQRLEKNDQTSQTSREIVIEILTRMEAASLPARPLPAAGA